MLGKIIFILPHLCVYEAPLREATDVRFHPSEFYAMTSPTFRKAQLLLLSLATFTACLGATRFQSGPADLLNEAIILTPQAGSDREDMEIAQWQKKSRATDARPVDFERLGWAYVAKARRTLDAGYYKLAEKTADVMDAKFAPSAESRLLRGHVFHNLHRFAEAETLARALVAERGMAADYALLCDALMEQGKLTAAVAACQKLVDLRPGVEAYSRIAHLRWLKGDLTGATVMMETAGRAASPRDPESRAWLLARLSGYYLQGGDAARALAVAESAISAASAYPPALLARGRALLFFGKNTDAISVLQRAADLNPLPEYQWWLADAQRAAGEEADAVKTEQAIKARGETGDPRTLALFLATRGDASDEAVRLAREELANRADVLTHDALAWALAAKGDLAGAQAESTLASAEHTRDARLLWHAGEIALAAGDRAKAAQAFAAARPLAATLTPSERTRLTQRLANTVAVLR